MTGIVNIGKLYNGLDVTATCKHIGCLIDKSELNDKELAEKMNISVQAINKWRHGHSIPDIENLYILSRILEVSVDDFLVPKDLRIGKAVKSKPKMLKNGLFLGMYIYKSGKIYKMQNGVRPL